MPIAKGYIHTPFGDAPALRAYVHLPRFNAGRYMEFLIDTGAKMTCLHPMDWASFVPASDWFSWSPSMSLGGISGSRQYALEQTIILFEEDVSGRYFVPYQSNIGIGLIVPGDINGPGIPSLLGRDVMDQGSIVVSSPAGHVSLDVPGVYLDEVLPSN